MIGAIVAIQTVDSQGRKVYELKRATRDGQLLDMDIPPRLLMKIDARDKEQFGSDPLHTDEVTYDPKNDFIAVTPDFMKKFKGAGISGALSGFFRTTLQQDSMPMVLHFTMPMEMVDPADLESFLEDLQEGLERAKREEDGKG